MIIQVLDRVANPEAGKILDDARFYIHNERLVSAEVAERILEGFKIDVETLSVGQALITSINPNSGCFGLFCKSADEWQCVSLRWTITNKDENI
ncbi:MAG: hypothetical protein ABIE68_03110 [bacterium]